MDGSIELLIAAPGNSQSGGDAGKVYLVEYSDLITATPNADLGEAFMNPSPSPQGEWFLGESFGDEAGSALATKDIDADGLKDFVIAAPGSDSNGDLSGSVYLWLANEPPSGQGAYLLWRNSAL